MALTITRRHVSVLSGSLTRHVDGSSAYFEPKLKNLEQIVAVIGPSGPAGSGTQQFNVTSPSASWIINHGFGRNPTVQVFTVDGELVIADVNVTSSTVSVALSSPMAGYVLLS